MVMRFIFLVGLSLVFFSSCYGQVGGTKAFALLDMSFHARQLALAGEYHSSKDADINMGISNPSLLNKQMDGALSVSQAFHPGAIKYGMVGYGRSLNDKQHLSANIRYVSYGRMMQTDKYGNIHGSFSPLEYIVGLGYGYQQNERIAIGVNWNFIGSHMANYNSFGSSIDLAGSYFNESEDFSLSAIFKNVGLQFNPYLAKRAPLPADFQLAISQRLAHAPFRFSLLFHHLNQWDITYYDPFIQPSTDILTGKLIEVKRAGFFEKLAQHVTAQIEIATKNIHVRVGFDYHTRKTMQLKEKPGLSGFAFGTGLRFKRFSLDYGFFAVSKAGSNHLITLSTSLSQMRK